uniref:Thiol-disulfide isomerase/thioredoxin n=1 Tax=Uncultured bacterium HF130_AEPn_1 TaxID=663362 RepID=D0E8J0_UNCHF|nr:thiol-disulfide isomerase/thioredoxin [uncultured bacterium HF130_AEPn_1]
MAAILLPFSACTKEKTAKSKVPDTSIYDKVLKDREWLNAERPLRSKDLIGKAVLFDFWTYCCINCIHVIPDLKYLEEKYGDKLVVIGVHSAKFTNEKVSKNIMKTIRKYGIEHPVINDKDFIVWRMFGARAWPTLALLDTTGRPVKLLSGEGHRETLDKLISKILDGKHQEKKLRKRKRDLKKLYFPSKMVYSKSKSLGELFFLTDSSNHRVLAIDLSGKVKMVIGSGKEGNKDGDIKVARFRRPHGLAFDEKNDLLYIADTDNHSIKSLDLKSKKVLTLSGNGERGFKRKAENAKAKGHPMASPWDLQLKGEKLLIAMAGTHQLWEMDLKKGTVSVIAGNGGESIEDGPYPKNTLAQTSGMDQKGDDLYFVDSETSSLRVLEKGSIRTLVGKGLFHFGLEDGPRDKAKFQHPLGIHISGDLILLADTYNHAIRTYDLKANTVSTLLKGKLPGGFEIEEPNDVLVLGKELFIINTNRHEILKYDLVSKKLSLFSLSF